MVVCEIGSRAEGHVRETIALAFPHGTPLAERFPVILSAYFDESGTHAGSAAVAVAGYISTQEKWEAFAAEWQILLDRYGLAVLHMKDIAHFHKKPEFAGWDEQRRRDCLGDAYAIINQHVLHSFAYLVTPASFRAIIPPWMQRSFGGAYGWAAAECFFLAADWMRQSGQEGRIAYFFDSGVKESANVAKGFLERQHDPQIGAMFHLGTFTLAADDMLLPLQAADVLAYELQRERSRQLGQEKGEARYPLGPLSKPSHTWQCETDDELRTKVQNIERYRRVIPEAPHDPEGGARQRRQPRR